jgi:hypothetical protein
VTDYRIEKLRCPVVVILADGQELSGDVFVQPVSRFRPEPQGAVDFLNEDDPFFALVHGPGSARLVAKDNVRRAEAPLPEGDDTLEFPRIGMNVEITLLSGEICAGSLFPDVRAERARLLDFLNSYTPRFLALFDPHKVTLINRRAIAHVREIA